MAHSRLRQFGFHEKQGKESLIIMPLKLIKKKLSVLIATFHYPHRIPHKFNQTSVNTIIARPNISVDFILYNFVLKNDFLSNKNTHMQLKFVSLEKNDNYSDSPTFPDITQQQ